LIATFTFIHVTRTMVRVGKLVFLLAPRKLMNKKLPMYINAVFLQVISMCSLKRHDNHTKLIYMTRKETRT
jgi:hypothetical protein